VAVAFDATRRPSVEQGFAYAVQRLGGLDVFVHAVGANVDAAFLELTDAQWDEAVERNLRSAFLCGQAAARAMKAQPRKVPGRIVLLASASALAGRRGASNYTAAKAGVLTMARTMALELAPDILVNALAPGVFDTDTVRALFDPQHLGEVAKATPMGRLGTPEELAEAALFLASDEASYVTGQVLVVDGGRLMR
jgi:3-oxoacyl-[acyl-carrier protein] reductase